MLSGGNRPAGSVERTAQVEALYPSMRRELFRLAVVLIGDPAVAEEFVHDAFLGRYRRWASLNDPASAPAYLRRSMINSCNSELRHRLVRRRRPEPLRVDRAGLPEDGVMLSAEHQQVLNAVRRLPRRQTRGRGAAALARTHRKSDRRHSGDLDRLGEVRSVTRTGANG